MGGGRRGTQPYAGSSPQSATCSQSDRQFQSPQSLLPHGPWANILTCWCGVQIDKEGANVERVKQGLSEVGLLPEEWGGQTPMVPVSQLLYGD